MFRPYYGPVTASDIILGILAWVATISAIAFFGYLIASFTISLYRSVAYDYQVAIMSAKITDKSLKPARTGFRLNLALRRAELTTESPEYKVHIVTSNGLKCTIYSAELYRWAKIGAKLRVTMKIGRSRRAGRKIKYWEVTDYSFPVRLSHRPIAFKKTGT